MTDDGPSAAGASTRFVLRRLTRFVPELRIGLICRSASGYSTRPLSGLVALAQLPMHSGFESRWDATDRAENVLDEKSEGGDGQISGQINWPKRGEAASDASAVAPKLDLHDVVETALAEALILAARAGRWAIVEQIAGSCGHGGTGRDGAPSLSQRARRKGRGVA